jgi:hypothetical protein
MMGLDDLFTTIALGTTLTRAVISLKKHISALRSGAAIEYLPPSALEALDRRTASLESLARRQSTRINDLESGLEDASAVTDALAHRVSTIFWIALMSGAVGLIALVVSIVAIAHGR